MAIRIPGYIGWVGHQEKQDLTKLYSSHLSVEMIDETFHDFASQFSLEVVKIDSSKGLKEAFNGTSHKPFSYFFNHSEFEAIVKQAELTLEDLINFMPSDEVKLYKEEEERRQWLSCQKGVIYNFFGCYKGYHCRNMYVTRDATVSYEDDHKSALITKLMNFGPLSYNVYEEVCVEPTEGSLPSGNIDIVGCEEHNGHPTSMVGIQCQFNVAKKDRFNVVSTSVKTEGTFSNPGSDRQVIVEVLALSEVTKQIHGNIYFVIMLKATKSKFRPYIYFPNSDFLIRTKDDVLIEANMKNDSPDHRAMMGTFILFLILHNAINPLFEDHIKDKFGDGGCCG